MPHFENDLSAIISLDGRWLFQLGGQPARDIAVPSAWEASDPDKLCDGPALYRRSFTLPEPGDARVLFEADAVSFAARVRVNGRDAGEHRGVWSGFQLDITDAVRAGDNAIELEVWKPGARHPLRECVAGFLPDVCNTFGGIWQSCRIRLLRDAAFEQVRLAPGELAARVRLFNARAHDVALRHNDTVIATLPIAALIDEQARFEIPALTAWPGNHALDTLTLTLRDAAGAPLAQTTRRSAARNVAAGGGAVRVNNSPVHLRGVLDWGWHPERLCPAPTRAEALDQFAAARALGFNLVKLCLFVPDETLFDAADEAGMLLWLELPLWLPTLTPESRALALREYDDILRRVHHHPSIVAVSLGCELDNSVDAGLLAELRSLVRHWMPNVLLCDNSGSSEAYSGTGATVTNALGERDDFRDYHFYCDPHFFQPLIDHFRRGYQGDAPWLFGEFCDADTLRDYGQLSPLPFWLTGPVTMQRDELRWQRESAERLSAAGIVDGGAELTRLAREQATHTRKTMLEITRRNFAGGGYVVTGWRDTPVATSGVTDDAGRLKFDPDAWRRFNAERVLLIDRERRREWVRGGDRPAPRDPTVFWADEALELRVLMSNGGDALPPGVLSWRMGAHRSDAAAPGSAALAGFIDAPAVPAASVCELGTLALAAPLPDLKEPAQTFLAASQHNVTNDWPLLFVPRLDVDALLRAPNLAFALDDTVLHRVRAGETMAVWLREPDARFCEGAPFVREAVHVLAWQPLGAIDIRAHLFSIATDFALNTTKLRSHLGMDAEPRALWRRFDARAMTWSAYVVEAALGRGRLRISALRHAGGLGAQPGSLAHNPLGAWLLREALSYSSRST